MKKHRLLLAALVAAGVLHACTAPGAADGRPTGADRGKDAAVQAIDTVVVIYAENRAFDTLYGTFPGANGIPGVNPSSTGSAEPQKDFSGAVLPTLPPVWGGVTAGGQPVAIAQAQTVGMPNKPFRIDDPAGFGATGTPIGQDVITRDLVHAFFINQMQINGGRNDRFAAYSDAGGLSMGYYDGSRMRMWKLAQQYTLADNFFMGAFGGSYLNHQYLVCACAPIYPNAPDSPARSLIAETEVDAQGNFVRLIPGKDNPASVLDGRAQYKHYGNITPREPDGTYRAVNTMQPPYQPSGNTPTTDPRLADPAKPTTLPAQTQATIADRLDAKHVGWAWYAGGWNTVTAGTPEARKEIYAGRVLFQPHHQPLNYYTAFDPVAHADARAAHFKDFDTHFFADADAGKLPAVTFYKPQGNLNHHAGYANLSDGDAHIAQVVERLQKSPQWSHMLIVVTYDENGGFYDHAPVPRGDRFGPGTRIPAIIVSPRAKKGFIDKTAYDTGSILRFITRRFGLEPLPGIVERDKALVANGFKPMGDLSAALE